jgi:chromosomal replication initiator protein
MPRPEPEFRSAIVSYLRKHRPELCRHWFEEIEPVSIASGTVFLLVREPVQLNFLRRHAIQAFIEAVQAHTGKLLGVKFIDEAEAQSLLASDSVTAPLLPSRSSAGSDRPGELDGEPFVLNPDCTFEHFIVGPGNKLAHAAAHAVSEHPGSAYNPLFIHSGVGLGKTHLLQAICQRLLAVNRHARFVYLPCNSFMERFTECVQAGRMSDFRHRFRGADVLIIDDVHDLSRNAQSQEEFFHTFNALQQAGKQIVLSADAPPEQISDIEKRLVSRFNSGLIAEIEKPCFETRKQIVRAKAALRNLALPDPAVELIADRRHNNIREIEGVLQAVQLRHSATEAPIDIDLVLQALGEAGPTGTSRERRIGIGMILDLVAKYYQLRVRDLTGRARPRSMVVPRQVAMYLAKRLTHMSYAEIGAHLGGRDHTTVLYGCRTIASRVASAQAGLERAPGAPGEFGPIGDLDRDLRRLENQLLGAAEEPPGDPLKPAPHRIGATGAL